MTDLDARAFVRLGNRLAPSDIMSDEFLASIPQGKEVLVKIRRARNVKHHRKLFALLNKVKDNSDRWPSVEVLLDELKLATGLAEVRVSLLNGKPYAVPASISFASMAQDKFAAWYDQALVIAARAINTTVEQLEREIETDTSARAFQ